MHIFPEGGRTRDPTAKMRHPFKLGIGQLLEAARPLAMPFYHYGMQDIMPIGQTLPKWGKHVSVIFGEHTAITSDFIAETNGGSDVQGPDSWQSLTDWAYNQLRTLEEQIHPHSGA